MSFKTLLENKKVVTKSVDFAGEKVEIRKLSSGEVLEIQTLGRDINKVTEGSDEVDVEEVDQALDIYDKTGIEYNVYLMPVGGTIEVS